MHSSQPTHSVASIPPLSDCVLRPDARTPATHHTAQSVPSQKGASGRRLPLARAVAAKCRECIHDPDAPGHAREQIAACPCTSCPLWPVRPLNRAAPDWLRSRDPARLPDEFPRLAQAEAIAAVRGNTAGILR